MLYDAVLEYVISCFIMFSYSVIMLSSSVSYDNCIIFSRGHILLY